MIIKKYPFVVVEGIDGVGKTTCAKAVAKKIGGIYYKTPSKKFEKERVEFDLSKNYSSRFLFYLKVVNHASSEISKLILKKPVVCDRYIYSTIAYHRALGVKIPSNLIEKSLILVPNLTIYLWADQKTCSQRITERGVYSNSDKELEKDKNLQEKIHKEFETFSLTLINTSNLTITEVSNKIIEIIQ